MDKEERNQKIELYGKGFELLLTALKDIPRQAWKFKPEPKEWSIHEKSSSQFPRLQLQVYRLPIPQANNQLQNASPPQSP